MNGHDLSDSERAQATDRRLLLGDDDENTVNYIAAMGSRCGYTTATAYDGVAAVTTAKKFGPDSAVIGIMMPRMNHYLDVAKCRIEWR